MWRKILNWGIPIVVVLIASAIFALRYLSALEIPNFYAEDGMIFVDNALRNNILESTLSAFNGYLVVGIYIPVEISVFIYEVFNLHFYQLATVLAVVSCLFLGFTVSLPFILLRKQLGVTLSLVAVVLGALVALPLSDYAIIGTIGNFKFLFLYWAFIFVLYRNFHHEDVKRTIATDVALLLCILTYAPAVAMLPFAIWPYKKRLLSLFSNKKRRWSSLMQPYIISLLVLCIVSAIYLLVVYLKGIPKIPGYLDTPYQDVATLKLAFRSTWYAWLYPIVATMRDLVVIGLLGLTLYFGLKDRRLRFITIFASWTILVATVGFVYNRPGISDYFLTYGHGPDQFFYAQSLVFLLLTVYLAKPLIDKLSKRGSVILLVGFVLYLIWSISFGSSYGAHAINYRELGTAEQNIEHVCSRQQGSEFVTFQVYPFSSWKWTLDRDIACK